MSSVHLTHFPGINAVGVVDFGGAAEAGTKVTIGGVTYEEKDTEDFPNGVWTNGASAADSATSFASAVNGDTRATKPAVTAVVSAAGDSVILVADQPGTDGNLALTEDSAANVTVENMHDGVNPSRKRVFGINYTVTAQDVLADEVNIGLPFTPTVFVVNVRTTAGVIKAATVEATVQSSPTRLRLNFAGATDPIAGDIVHVMGME